MLKKISISILIVAFSVISLFAQETTTTTTTDTTAAGEKPRQQLDQNFVDALMNQDESLLISAIESGTPEVKAVCFEVSSKLSTSLITASSRSIDK